MKRAVLLIFLGFFTVMCGFAQADLQPAAIVNLIRSEPITVKQFRTEVERMESSAGRSLNQNERLQVLDVMINERLVLQAADRDRITVTENEINQHLQQLRGILAQNLNRQPTDAEFGQAIRNEYGVDLPAYRDQLRRELIANKYLMSKKEDSFRAITPPSEEEIRSQYNLARANFVRPETVRFSMIQVPYGPDAASRNRARDTANGLVREIGSSASKFDEIVTRGQTANSAYQSGDGGFLPRTMDAQAVVGPEFINTAFSLRQGEVSKLIEGVPGYQIIKITESYDMKNLELDDIFRLGTRVTVRDYIGSALLENRQQMVLAQATQELVTELRTGRSFQIFERNLTW